MAKVGWLRIWLALSLVVAVMAVAGCSSAWHPPKVTLPRRGPVDVFLDVIDQISQLGESIARRFRGLSGGRL